MFRAGMKVPASLAALGDRPDDWTGPFEQAVDGVVPIGDEDRSRPGTVRRQVRHLMTERHRAVVF